MQIRQLNSFDIEEIKVFFKSVFTAPPWNDDWSDEGQLSSYINDLVDNKNSLAFGLYGENGLVGISLGNVRHWYTGTEYFIDEFCICTKSQGQGLGTQFLKAIEEKLKEKGIVQIYLQTQRNVPAYEFYRKNGFYQLEEQVSLAKKII